MKQLLFCVGVGVGVEVLILTNDRESCLEVNLLHFIAGYIHFVEFNMLPSLLKEFVRYTGTLDRHQRQEQE